MRMPSFLWSLSVWYASCRLFCWGRHYSRELIEKCPGVVSLDLFLVSGSNMLCSGYKGAQKKETSEEDEGRSPAKVLTTLLWKAALSSCCYSNRRIAVGCKFLGLGVDILVASALFGIITAILCTIALFIGKNAWFSSGRPCHVIGQE